MPESQSSPADRSRVEASAGHSGSLFVAGSQAAWPICLGYVPIGLAFGVLAQKAGFSMPEVGLMSVLVFAGSAQFIGVAMWQGGAGALAIVATTLVVNLRHVLMSSSLAPYLKRCRPGFVTVFSYGVTDESFAVNLGRFRDQSWDPKRALILNQAANACWVVSTVAGAGAGQFIPERAFGIDYALIAMFLCLLVFQLRGRIYVMTGLIAGVLALGLSLLVPGNLHVVTASIAAATIGYAVRDRKRGT